jgi:uncharacterized protein YkwD
MKARLIGLAVVCTVLLLTLLFSGSRATQSQTKNSDGDGLSQPERDLLSEINQARAHPAEYASYLEKLKPNFNGREYKPTGGDSFTTQEGWSAVEDAIKFLHAASPQPALSMSKGLCLAALTHVKDQSASGATGHKGGDRTMIEDRVKPFGQWDGGIGENLTYGNQSARERILTWLIDDGFASRGHRNRLMSTTYRVAGISCGPHPEFGSMCVVTLAGGFSDLKTVKPATENQTNTNADVNAPSSKPKGPTSKRTTKRRSHKNA